MVGKYANECEANVLGSFFVRAAGLWLTLNSHECEGCNVGGGSGSGVSVIRIRPGRP